MRIIHGRALYRGKYGKTPLKVYGNLLTFADINHTANKTLGYTALMGVPPKVQPTFVNIYNHTGNKTLGYTYCTFGCAT